MMYVTATGRLKANCHGADWVNKKIREKGIRQAPGISVTKEIA